MRQGYMLSIATRYQRRNKTNNTIALQLFLSDFYKILSQASVALFEMIFICQLHYNTKRSEIVTPLLLFTVSSYFSYSQITQYPKNDLQIKIKKAETIASTFDMIAYDHRKSNKRIDLS